MKKWLIPVSAILIVGVIALLTQRFVLHSTDHHVYTFYMISIGDKGKQGAKVACDDSLVPVERQAVSDTHITDVYQDIIDMHDQKYENTELINSLYQSQLQYESAIIDATGIARIDLNGTLAYGDRCAAQRIKAQLEEPAYQFDGVTSVEVTINDVPLDKLLHL